MFWLIAIPTGLLYLLVSSLWILGLCRCGRSDND